MRFGHCLLVSSVVTTLCGCTGTSGGGQPATGSNGAGGKGQPGTGPGAAGGPAEIAGDPSIAVLRRLNATEYNNTVRDLLGDVTSPAKAFPPDERAFGFNNNGQALTASPVLVSAQLAAAEALAKTAVAELATLVPCASLGDDACARQFIAEFGQRAFRRPVEPSDAERLMALFVQGKEGAGFAEGIELVVAGILVSPLFLYRVETSPKQLDSWETASRLSYLLWQTLPDATLFDAARSGALATAPDVRTQAERLLGDARARATLLDFHAQWLKYDELDSVTKSAEDYPDFTPAIARLMREELDSFVTFAAFDAPSTLQTLMNGDVSFVNQPLADFYGLPGVVGDSFGKVTLDSQQRSGILTRGGLLSVLSHANQTSPTLRGKFIRTQFLCEAVPPPPPSVVNAAPVQTPTSTARERMLQHTTDAQCAGCHSILDPIGFGLENLDATGRWRDVDGGKPVDASGNLAGTDVGGAFTGPAELAQKLSTSKQVAACMTSHLLRFALGRKESGGDEPLIQALAEASQSGTLVSSVLALVESEAFRNR